MLAIFSAVANIVLDSGFSAALIQKKETTEEEFSSVFWFNLGMSILLYGTLLGCSPLIARFFNQPRLVELSAIIFLALPVNSLTIIQTTLLNKQVRFRQLTRINLLSMLFSGIASLLMAVAGCGVWTLAFQPVILAGVRAAAVEQGKLASATGIPPRPYTVIVRLCIEPIGGKPHQHLFPEYLLGNHRKTVPAKTTGLLYTRQ